MKHCLIFGVVSLLIATIAPVIEGLQCHTCSYYENYPENEIPEDDKDVIHESCKDGNIPEDRFIQDCETEQVCLKLRASNGISSFLRRECRLEIPEFADQECINSTLGGLKEIKNPSPALLETIKGLEEAGNGDSIMLGFCFCKLDRCLFLESRSSGSIRTLSNSSLIAWITVLFCVYRISFLKL